MCVQMYFDESQEKLRRLHCRVNPSQANGNVDKIDEKGESSRKSSYQDKQSRKTYF